MKDTEAAVKVNRERIRRRRKMDGKDSQGSSIASTSTEEESFREEEFERYQKRLTKEAGKRKERESCEQVAKDIGKLKFTIAAQGKRLESLSWVLNKRNHEVGVWKVEQLTRELTLTRERDQVRNALQTLTTEQAVTKPGLLKALVCFGCGQPGHVIKFCRRTERSTRFSRVHVPLQSGLGKDRVVQ
jgi:hypothetical protein